MGCHFLLKGVFPTQWLNTYLLLGRQFFTTEPPRKWEPIYSRAYIHLMYLLSFSHAVMADSLWPCGLQHARLPCPSSPEVCSDSCPLSRWGIPIIVSSVIPFFLHLQSFPALGLLYWVGFSHQVAKILEFQLQDQSFQWTLRTDMMLLNLTYLHCL